MSNLDTARLGGLHPNRKLTPSLRDMLDRIRRASDGEDGCQLMLSIVAAGGRELTKLRNLREAGWVEYCDHPTVVGRGGAEPIPARAVRITDAGRTALASKP